MLHAAFPTLGSRFIAPTLLTAVLLLSGCSSSGDAKSVGDNAGSLTMSPLTELPTVGGDATGVAFLDADTVIAAMDGKLYAVPVAGGAPTLLADNVMYQNVAVGGHGEVYAFTGDEFWVVDGKGGTPRKADLPARTPQTLNTYLSIGPDGQAYVRILSYPSVIKIYTSADSGVTWTELALPPAHAYGGGLAFGETTDEIYLSDPMGFHASQDGGKTWVSSPAAVPNYGPEIVRRKNGDILCYAAKGGGLRVSHDQGKTFSDLSPFNASPFIWKLLEADDETLYATLTTSSMGGQLALMSSSDGKTWKHVYAAQGHDFALLGAQLAFGQASTGGLGIPGAGGVALSADHGATFATNGLASVKAISSFGFDQHSKLLLIGDTVLFRQQADGWQALGAPGGSAVATTPKGTIYMAGEPTYVSTDDGATWTAAELPKLAAGPGTFRMPVAVALRDESFLISRTTYRDDLYPPVNTNGQLTRITPDGEVTPTAPGLNFISVVQDADGLLYGGTDNFSTAQHSSDSGLTWEEVNTPAPGFAFDDHNRYVKYGELGTFRSGVVGSADTKLLTLDGFTSSSNQVTSAKFDAAGHLYLLSADALFIATGTL